MLRTCSECGYPASSFTEFGIPVAFCQSCAERHRKRVAIQVQALLRPTLKKAEVTDDRHKLPGN